MSVNTLLENTISALNQAGLFPFPDSLVGERFVKQNLNINKDLEKRVVVGVTDVGLGEDRGDGNLTVTVEMTAHWELPVKQEADFDPAIAYHNALVLAAWLRYRGMEYNQDREGTVFILQEIIRTPIEVEGYEDLERLAFDIVWNCEIQYEEGVYTITVDREGAQVTLPLQSVYLDGEQVYARP